jgi:hypothetical protein
MNVASPKKITLSVSELTTNLSVKESITQQLIIRDEEVNLSIQGISSPAIGLNQTNISLSLEDVQDIQLSASNSQGAKGDPGEPGPNNITILTETDLNGILKGDGFNVGVAIPGIDYLLSSSIINHNALNNLDYASAGHTGFQPALGFTPADSLITITGTGLLAGQGGDLTVNRIFTLNNADIDHDSITNTHNLTTDIDHGLINGLGDDDHLQYMPVNASRDFTGSPNLNSYNLEYRINGNKALGMPVDNTNLALGYQSLNSVTSGQYNFSAGYQSSYSLLDGIRNMSFGYQSLYSNISGNDNIAIGANSLEKFTSNFNLAIGTRALRYFTGEYNVGIGYQSLLGVDGSSTGWGNIGIGYLTLQNLESGNTNIVIGSNAGKALVDGVSNIAIGYQALLNTTSNGNIAIGTAALALNNITGSGNIGIGPSVLYSLSSGSFNVAFGVNSGRNVSTGWGNSFFGYASGYNNTVGFTNLASGYQALYFNQSGDRNVAIGYQAMYGANGNSPNYDIAVGYRALRVITTATYDIAIGYEAGSLITTGGNNICIGYRAGDVLTTGANNIIIGHDVDPSGAIVSNELNIGNTIYGDLANNKIAIGAMPLTNECDVGCLNDGILALKETTTPTADNDYGKIYTKNDNKLYFQDGAGVEHEVALV